MKYLELTARQTELHTTALRLSREHRELEAKLCECLREIDQTKLFKKLGHSSLFVYATRELGLTEAIAYAFISVARKSREIPHLKSAIEEKTLSVAKASRMVSGLTLENAGELIAFAKTHSMRELEGELARRNPKCHRPDHVRALDHESVEIRARLPKRVNEKLERVMALLAQKQKPTDLGTAIESALDEYLKHHDPVEKAKRAKKRSERKELASRQGSVMDQLPEWSQNFSQSRNSAMDQVPVLNREFVRNLSRNHVHRKDHGLSQELLQDQEPILNQGFTLNQSDELNPESALSQTLVPNRELTLGRGIGLTQKPGISQEVGINLESTLGHGLDLNQKSGISQKVELGPKATPSQSLKINNGNLLRTRRVCAEASGAPSAPAQCPSHDCMRNTDLKSKQNRDFGQDSLLSKVPMLNPSHKPNRKSKQGQVETLNYKSIARRPLSAVEKHAVFLRDQGRCTFVNERGERCSADRWLHLHHIKPVSRGGSNNAGNLSLLCSYHHDVVHQLSFSLGQGEINWLRSPVKEYVA